VEKNAASPKAEASLKAMGIMAQSVDLRQVKYLNNLVEQDHRFMKRLVKPGMGFFSVETAWRRRDDAYASQRANTRGRKGEHHGAGHVSCPPVWSGSLS
jgi:transposase-like protein